MTRFDPRTWRGEVAALSPVQRRVVIGTAAAFGFVLLAGLSFGGYFLGSAPRFPRPPYRQPSRLYGRATHLAPGMAYAPTDLVAELEDSGYREAPADGPLPAGAFRRASEAKEEDKDKKNKKDKEKEKDEIVALHLRRFPTPSGRQGGAAAEVTFKGGQVTEIRIDGKPAQGLDLEPPLLASYYGPEGEERRPVLLKELPEEVIFPVLAAEDAAFYNHAGLSAPGMARAAIADLRGRGVQQGGSTLTQQLVKNLYLTQKRTLGRKMKEAVLAVLIEIRHNKRAILEAYLNEIYWGKSGSANLIGLGAAARGYFGKDPAELTLAEAATLAGMIRAPGDYSPLSHPDRAIERRNHVIERMAELGWIPKERARAALAEPLQTAPDSFESRRMAPYFASAMAAEAKERWKIEDLADAGYSLFSTVSWREQHEAEAAVAAGLASLEKGAEAPRRQDRGEHGQEPLQASLLSIDPRDGSILAYVGGRDYGKSQFDRIAQARRQAGSAIKPVIYAAAFSEGVATTATLLNDSPIVVKFAGQSWSPQDNDHSFRGWVTVRTALEQSLNVPSVRLALGVGLNRVVTLAHDMGIEGELKPIPALALGAFGVTPRELATVYGTLANGGTRPEVHGLATVVAPRPESTKAAEPLAGPEPAEPHRVLQAQPAYLVTSVLQGVLDRGTAAGARSQGVQGELAGKTGTTNGRRDNWFAGYSPDRVTVVWVGYDDNAKSRLSGSSAALPIWSRFVRAVRPAAGYPAFAVPSGIVKATVDPTTGMLATPSCPYAVADFFLEWKAPVEPCTVHQPGGVLAGGAVGTEPWQSASLPPLQPAAGQPFADGTGGNAGDIGKTGNTGDMQVGAPAQPGDARPGTILIRRSQGTRTPEIGVRPADPAAAAPSPAEGDDAAQNEPSAANTDNAGNADNNAEDPAPADAGEIPPPPPPPGGPGTGLEVLSD
jgi:penicillin-binding protein 1B